MLCRPIGHDPFRIELRAMTGADEGLLMRRELTALVRALHIEGRIGIISVGIHHKRKFELVVFDHDKFQLGGFIPLQDSKLRLFQHDAVAVVCIIGAVAYGCTAIDQGQPGQAGKAAQAGAFNKISSVHRLSKNFTSFSLSS